MLPTVYIILPWLFQYATCNLLANVYILFLFLTDPSFPPRRNPSLLMLLTLFFPRLNLLLDSSAFHSLLVLPLVNSPALIKMLPVLSTERSPHSSAAFFYVIKSHFQSSSTLQYYSNFAYQTEIIWRAL